jgi:single-strand DNA-binding protein
MDVNKVTLVGNLTAKPECDTAASGQRTATFTLATSYSWKESNAARSQATTDLHRVHVWGTLAEIVEKYLDRGARVYVEGRLATTRSGDPVEVVGDEIILLGRAQ